ncbi:hypothetical protein R5R35_003871 [Gryllus longicercus]|uniref:Integrator complex subunit 12 n=1 Tax=Gryllus longicercus TaxID=2509291 RepID=A0AAN9V2C7_9ORTH
MASLEIDPGYIKCLRLMHSKSKESEEQLRQMLEDLIRQRNGNTKSIASLQKREVSTSKKEKHSSGSNGRKDELKRESEKHTFEESAGSSRETSKKSKTELPKTSHLKSSSSTPTSPLSPAKSFLSDVDVKEEVKEDDDHDDLALEILEEDLTCVVCHGMDVGVRNQLVECLECHSLYHQECHNPPVPDDMNDPRSAWYCASCTKVLKKIPSSSRSSPKPNNTTPSKSEKDVVPAPAKVTKPEPSQSQSPFKRTEKLLPRQSKPSSQQYSRSQPQNKQHQLQKLRKMLSPRSPSVGNDKN